MQGYLSTVFVSALALMLALAAIGDVRRREIPNWLNGAIAVLALPFWLSIGLSPWPDMALQFAVAVGVFATFALLFYFGLMGGGDVKMMAALALWLPADLVPKVLIIMSIAGGVLTLAMIARKRLAKGKEHIEVPYGVAIAFAGLWVIAEPFLNQFGS